MNSAAQVETFSPSLIALQHESCVCKTAPTKLVSLSEAELERHISSCARLVEIAYARYESSSDLSDLGEAHRWRLLMEQAIAGRSAEQIARMEQARGLS